MRCIVPTCNAELYPGDMFCGRCGRPVSTTQHMGSSQSTSGLFPLYGVMLGETTVSQLAQLGKRTGTIDKSTKAPHKCYMINGTNFWYDGDVADHLYIAKGIYSIPESWRALGFDWDRSYNQWISLFQHIGCSVTITQSPKIVKYDGHNSFSAKVSALWETRIPIEIKLRFDYSQGGTADSEGTLYSISVNVAKS